MPPLKLVEPFGEGSSTTQDNERDLLIHSTECSCSCFEALCYHQLCKNIATLEMGSTGMANIYFHVDHDTGYTQKGLHAVGQVIDTEKRKHNPYYEAAMDFHSVYPVGNKGYPLLEFFRSDTAQTHAAKVMPDVQHIVGSHLKIIRELVFESVRTEHFAALPSRTRCLWLSKSLVEARSWVERLPDRGKAQILRVSVEGRLHEGSEGHLQEDSQSMPRLIESAHRYWRGEMVTGSRSETLLEGTMTVLEVVG